MKKIAMLLVLFVTATNLYSQELTKDELKTKLAEHTCECSNSKEMTKDNYELNLGLCILEAVNKYQSSVEKYYGKNYISKIEEIGGDVGETMAGVCPDLLIKIFQNSQEQSDSYDSSVEDETINGTFVNTNEDGFLYVNVKEASGKSHKFLLLDNFDNSYLIIDNVLKSKDKIKVSYYVAELYNTKTKKYENFKVISDIEKE